MSDMKFQLSSEQRALVGTVRELARDKFRGRAMKWLDGTFPWENMRELAQIGVLGMSVPGGVRRLQPAGVRHRARARGSLQGLLRDVDGADG